MRLKPVCLAAVLWLLGLLAGCSLLLTDPAWPQVPRNERQMEAFTTDDKGRAAYPGAILGVDVSDHQGQIDWAAVRADGVEFAILRIGFRGYSVGSVKLDETFAQNYVEARQAGLKVGVYFYSQAVSEAEAQEEANWVVRMLDELPLDLPVFYDWEEVPTGRTGGKATSAVGNYARDFCQIIAQSGYEAGVYFNQRYGYSIMHLERLTEHTFWIAEYQSYQSFGYQTVFWQFSNKGYVEGINTTVDLDLMYPAEEKYEQTEENHG